MQCPTFIFLGAVLATLPMNVFADASSSPITPSCVTITDTTGVSCPLPSATPCIQADCLILKTITLECGCPSIYHTTVCETTCNHGCGTTYETLYIPCATSVSSPFSSTIVTTATTTTSSSSSSSSASISSTGSSSAESSTALSSTTTVSTGTETGYFNYTITITSITTLSTCPDQEICTGQTTTVSGTSGPLSCPVSNNCTYVLPGNPTQTVTEVTVTTPTKTGPTPTASSTGGGSVQASEGTNHARFGLIGAFMGLLGAVWGLL